MISSPRAWYPCCKCLSLRVWNTQAIHEKIHVAGVRRQVVAFLHLGGPEAAGLDAFVQLLEFPAGDGGLHLGHSEVIPKDVRRHAFTVVAHRMEAVGNLP